MQRERNKGTRVGPVQLSTERAPLPQAQGRPRPRGLLNLSQSLNTAHGSHLQRRPRLTTLTSSHRMETSLPASREWSRTRLSLIVPSTPVQRSSRQKRAMATTLRKDNMLRLSRSLMRPSRLPRTMAGRLPTSMTKADVHAAVAVVMVRMVRITEPLLGKSIATMMAGWCRKERHRPSSSPKTSTSQWTRDLRPRPYTMIDMKRHHQHLR
mmetsp:Transcript_13810/g.44177  ORF Transcript_13810/g.44177 Transcript_13810/m.44177 type:complete len:210 (+) Transcript_13810:720-1349(+)